MTGHPDDQGFANTSSGNLLAFTALNLPAGHHPTALIPVSQWLSLATYVNPAGGAAEITATYFADPGGLTSLGQEFWRVNGATALNARSPVRGAFVQIDIFVTSVANLTGTAWVNFQSAASDRVSYPVGFQKVSDSNKVLAASAGASYQLPLICAGDAQWYFFPHDTAAQLDVFISAQDENGNLIYVVDYRGKPAGLDNAVVKIPDTIMVVQVVNRDAANPHTFDFALTVPAQ